MQEEEASAEGPSRRGKVESNTSFTVSHLKLTPFRNVPCDLQFRTEQGFDMANQPIPKATVFILDDVTEISKDLGGLAFSYFHIDSALVEAHFICGQPRHRRKKYDLHLAGLFWNGHPMCGICF